MKYHILYWHALPVQTIFKTSSWQLIQKMDVQGWLSRDFHTHIHIPSEDPDLSVTAARRMTFAESRMSILLLKTLSTKAGLGWLSLKGFQKAHKLLSFATWVLSFVKDPNLSVTAGRATSGTLRTPQDRVVHSSWKCVIYAGYQDASRCQLITC